MTVALARIRFNNILSRKSCLQRLRIVHFKINRLNLQNILYKVCVTQSPQHDDLA